MLTQKGDYYFTNIQQGIQILLQATHAIMDPMRDKQIRMSVVPFFATRWLMPALESFQSQYPGWELAIQTSTQKSDFDLEDLNLVIRRGAGNWPGMCQHLLLEEHLIAVAPPALSATLHSLQDLERASLLYNSQVPTEWQDWFSQLGHTFAPSSARLKFQNNSQIIEACITGAGVALMDIRLVRDELKTKRLLPVQDHCVSGMRNHYLVYPKSHQGRASITLFKNWIETRIREEKE